MTLALWCLPVAIFLPYVFTSLAKSMTSRATGTFDNRDPRAFLAGAEGAAKRAHNVQLNTFEALPGFIAGVLTASMLDADPSKLDALAGVWILLRITYGACYVADYASLRSLVWFAALGCVLAMFGICA
jgi:uncharacterized MAPEG superfamily protein